MNVHMLSQFIAMHSVDNHPSGNQDALSFLTDYLATMGFVCTIKGQSKTDQPTLIAHYPGKESRNKIVLYGHYDVAPVNNTEQWKSQDPFQLECIDKRYFARGIADNKGPLMARLEAISELITSGQPLPEILWLIQGEEEVAMTDRVAKGIFHEEIERFSARVFIEETGFNNLDTDKQIAFLWSPGLTRNELVRWRPLIQQTLQNVDIEYRHLNKFNGVDACPLLGNLPEDGVYIGFGPNDKLHNIHRDNESLCVQKLNLHRQQFKEFLRYYAGFI